MNDYLWDKSGRDPGVESLERLLAPAALAAPLKPRPSRAIAWIAGLAAAALFAIGSGQALRRPAIEPSPWVTEQDGRRRLDMGRYGEVVAERDAQVRVVRMDDSLHSLRLDRGTLHASITKAARPRLFQVETPAATCIDLGCRYTLTVDARGVSHVRVRTGRVAFNDGRREVFIPEGASGRAAPGLPPFTPIHDDASPELKKAVDMFDSRRVGHRAAEAKAACALIRSRNDGLIAWHWLQDSEKDVARAARESLIRLSKIVECGVPAPADGEPDELKAWRDGLFPEWKEWD